MIELGKPAHINSPMFVYAKRNAYNGGFNIITQLFGENLASFYKTLGLKGHNGVDLVIQDSEEVYASHNGKVTKVYNKQNSNKTKGFGVYLTHPEGYTTVYWHLTENVMVGLGDEVKEGQVIGYADNSGEYTLGTHLHFGLYPKDKDVKNGYGGAIDPMPYFKFLKRKYMKIIGDKLTKNQYALGYDGKIRLIYNIATLNEGHDAGIWNKNEVEWRETLTYPRGNDIILISND